MGYRIHYATTYNVKWGGGDFSHCTDLNDTLRDLCPTMSSNDDFDSCADELEITREELANAIEQLKVRQNELDDGIDDRPLWMQLSKFTWDNIRDFLQEALDNSDKNNEFVKFSWY